MISRVPANTDAIFVAGLPRMPTENFEALIGDINAARHPQL